jgi:hypothetical protein
MNRITMLVLLVGLAVVATPLMVLAQCIEVTPENWDYGDVKVGTGESQIITIHSCASTDLTVYYVGLMEGAFEAFTVGTVPDVPFALPDGETLEVEVTFTPPALGVHEASFCVIHDAPGGETCVDLVGVGVRGWRRFEAKAAP